MNDLFGGRRAPPKGVPSAAATPASASYSAKDIEVLEGLEPVRRRPGMYIGGTDENALHTQSDDLAERIVQLGGTANGTTQVLANSTRLPPYPTDLYAGMDHVAALADRYAQVAKALRQGIDQADEAGDADTADLLTEQSRAVDKMLWMLEAHLPENTGR